MRIQRHARHSRNSEIKIWFIRKYRDAVLYHQWKCYSTNPGCLKRPISLRTATRSPPGSSPHAVRFLSASQSFPSLGQGRSPRAGNSAQMHRTYHQHYLRIEYFMYSFCVSLHDSIHRDRSLQRLQVNFEAHRIQFYLYQLACIHT